MNGTVKGLVEILRDTRRRTPFEPWARQTMSEAADRIERLEAQRVASREALSTAKAIITADPLFEHEPDMIKAVAQIDAALIGGG